MKDFSEHSAVDIKQRAERIAEIDKQITAFVAFWDGKSRGAKNMIELAHQHGLKVRVKNY